MLDKSKQEKIIAIWNEYVHSNHSVLDTKGNELHHIDQLRRNAIVQLTEIILLFNKEQVTLGEFKTSIDSFNKRNNLWGFTAIKGQFFFNQLSKNLNDKELKHVEHLLRSTIEEPNNLQHALAKIEQLETYCVQLSSKAKDRRLVPNSKSVGYFLSYFWQIANPEIWPMYYTASIQALKDVGVWTDKNTQKENYEQFYFLNEKIKTLLSEYGKEKISNWDVEHAFWLYMGNPNKKMEEKKVKAEETLVNTPTNPQRKASFELTEYLIPRVSKLIELGNSTELSASKKGHDFEKIVAEIFSQLDFDVEFLGQGTGRNPDAIIKCRSENTAFLVDAKAYLSGYSLGTDDRAIREYILHYCPLLQKDGYKKIGFIIVSNEFKSNFQHFIHDITWNTDIKRFLLLTSEALLYLLAFKTKDKLSITSIIESVVGFGNLVTAEDVINEFDDV